MRHGAIDNPSDDRSKNAHRKNGEIPSRCGFSLDRQERDEKACWKQERSFSFDTKGDANHHGQKANGIPDEIGPSSTIGTHRAMDPINIRRLFAPQGGW